MANRRILETLETYTGDAETLEVFSTVAAQELGEQWTERIYAEMADAPDGIKERLDHAFNYYAATTAWNEIQGYLTQQTPLDYQQTLERVPVLEHWLSFFGAAGEDVVAQLRNRLRQQAEQTRQSTKSLDEPFGTVERSPQTLSAQVGDISSEAQNVSDMLNESISVESTLSDENDWQLDEMVLSDVGEDTNLLSETSHPDKSVQENIVRMHTDKQHDEREVDRIDVQYEAGSVAQPAQDMEYVPHGNVFNPIGGAEPSQNKTPLQMESEESWNIGKIFRQVDFISNIESWISFRCLELGYTDFYTYRYYGFLVDVLDKTIEELSELLSHSELYDLIEERRKGGVHFLQNRLLAYQKSSKEAHEGVLSDLSPLMREGLSVDDLKNRLGGMDLSGEKEYLGPAPDGFEMVDDPYEKMNDDELKKEYEKIEAQGNLQPQPSGSDSEVLSNISVQSSGSEENSMQSAKSTSQTSQNSVQPKMAFKWNKFGTSA